MQSYSLVLVFLAFRLVAGFSIIPSTETATTHRSPSRPTLHRPSLSRRGGASLQATTVTTEGLCNKLASAWGTGGVLYILSKAIARVAPIAMEPFVGDAAVVPLSKLQLGIYIATCVWFAYVEGYKGFQLKFSPLVVKRSFTIAPTNNPVYWILAPLYSMGLMHATKKRLIVSWSLTVGLSLLVGLVKRLPYPWRNIVDAGVVVGLTWGSLAILWNYLSSLITGQVPSTVDAALPEQQ